MSTNWQFNILRLPVASGVDARASDLRAEETLTRLGRQGWEVVIASLLTGSAGSELLVVLKRCSPATA